MATKFTPAYSRSNRRARTGIVYYQPDFGYRERVIYVSTDGHRSQDSYI